MDRNWVHFKVLCKFGGQGNENLDGLQSQYIPKKARRVISTLTDEQIKRIQRRLKNRSGMRLVFKTHEGIFR